MLKTLKEISPPYDAASKGASGTSRKADRDATLMPPPPSLPEKQSIGIREIRPGGRLPTADDEEPRQRTSSLVRSIASSDTGSQTEEEDGHVLVRRP